MVATKESIEMMSANNIISFLTYVKPSQIRDVIKGYFLDLELKAAFGIMATKWAV